MKIRYTDHIVGTDGRFGNAVFGRWRNQEVARRWVKPRDPRSTGQVNQRRLFANASKTWRNWSFAPTTGDTHPPVIRTSWNLAADDQDETAQNLYIRDYIETLADSNNVQSHEFAYRPPNLPAPSSINLTGSSTSIDFTMNIPSPPRGFTTLGHGMVGWKDFDPKAENLVTDLHEQQFDEGPGRTTGFFAVGSTGTWYVQVLTRFQYNLVPADSPIRIQYGPSTVRSVTVGS